jgi:hypothetical protein
VYTALHDALISSYERDFNLALGLRTFVHFSNVDMRSQ